MDFGLFYILRGEKILENWDVYDVNGIPTGITKTRKDVFDDGEYFLSVCTWIVNTNGELLVQKRSANKRIRPNVWGGTVGTAVAGETSVNGCIREVKEEIGIEIGEQELIFLSRIFRGNRIFDDYMVVKDIPIEKIIIKPDEVSEVKWVSMDEVKSLWASGLFLLNEIDDMKLVFDYIHKHLTV